MIELIVRGVGGVAWMMNGLVSILLIVGVPAGFNDLRVRFPISPPGADRRRRNLVCTYKRLAQIFCVCSTDTVYFALPVYLPALVVGGSVLLLDLCLERGGFDRADGWHRFPLLEFLCRSRSRPISPSYTPSRCLLLLLCP